MEEIEADIKELRDSGWQFDRIYLQGADPLIRSYEDLVKIAEMIHKYLPEVETTGGYARVDNLKNKTVEQLKICMSLVIVIFILEWRAATINFWREWIKAISLK